MLGYECSFPDLTCCCCVRSHDMMGVNTAEEGDISGDIWLSPCLHVLRMCAECDGDQHGVAPVQRGGAYRET